MPFLTKLGVNLPTPTPNALPGNVVIFYSPSTTPVVAPVGWENYTAINGYPICGGSPTQVPGTIQTVANNITANARPLYTVGSHTGPFFSSDVWNGPGVGWPNGSTASGNHIHGWVNFSFHLIPPATQFHLLRATQAISQLPAGAVVIKEIAPTQASTQITSWQTYIRGQSDAAGSFNAGLTSQWQSLSSPTAGGHYHDVGSNRAKTVPTPFSPRNSTREGGTHFHSVNVTASASRYNGGRVVKMYRMTNPSELEAGMIVGTTAGWGTVLPDNWAWCDGSNGTLNLYSTFPYIDNQAWGTNITSNHVAFVESVGTSGGDGNFVYNDNYHAHYAPGTHQPPVPVSLQHNFTWVPHNHSFDLSYSGGTVGSRAYLGFIQFLG